MLVFQPVNHVSPLKYSTIISGNDDQTMTDKRKNIDREILESQILETCRKYLKYDNISVQDLLSSSILNKTIFSVKYFFTVIILVVFSICYQCGCYDAVVAYALGVRCIVPNNYFVWEATRPLSDCNYCINVTEPIILKNVTRESFKSYAYTSKPIVVRAAFLEWPAMKYFNFNFFKELYDNIEDSCRSVDEECQFLHFKSDFISIRDVFSMSNSRISNRPGEKSWYVGWGNCHPQVLHEMRKYYTKPNFLPEDCEIPSKDYVFMGYDMGATMHLDFINRLMWQAQLKGSKTWYLVPSPECENVCSRLSFVVEPGDAVLVDTRVWYHGTEIRSGEFSLSVQSEYG